MEDNDFEFPPDPLDDAVASRLSPYQSALPSVAGGPLPFSLQSVPLNALAQLPVDQLPPTQPNNPQRFSIGQVLRGAMSASHLRATPSVGSERHSLKGVTPLPQILRSSPHSPAATSYHSPIQAPPPSLPSDEEDLGRSADDEFRIGRSGEIGTGGSDARDAGVSLLPPPPRLPSRQARIDWTDGEVRIFYKALSQYGTDFSAIAVLLPGRHRNDVKRLYQREMRQRPEEVQMALNHKSPIDMALFEKQYEAKKKETQEAVEKTEVKGDQLDMLDEIARGALSRSSAPAKSEQTDTEIQSLAATEGEWEDNAAASPLQKPRKRKRETRETMAGLEKSEKPSTASAAGATLAQMESGADNESLFEMAMRQERREDRPFAAFFLQQQPPLALDDADFTFD